MSSPQHPYEGAELGTKTKPDRPRRRPGNEGVLKMGMIKANAQELKARIENRPTFEPINLKCNGGFPYNAGVLNYEDSGDNQNGVWMFSNGQVGGNFEASEEFVLTTIGINYQAIAEYFKG